jgi:hypothetical protein
MATTSDTPVLRFAEPFSDLPSQWLEASTRAITASAEIYSEVLNTQAEATRALFAAYRGIGAQTARTGAERATATAQRAAETTGPAAETTARTTRSTARTTSRAAKRTTRRAAGTTRKAAKPAARAAKPAAHAGTDAAKPAARAATDAAKPAARAATDAAKPAARAATDAATASAPPAPIAGYDGLTAEDLVAKLREQPQTALAEIAAYEQANEKRATVLQRVAALSGPEPARGYDALTAEEAQQLVANGSPALAAAVRDYERRHKDRTGVVEAAVRRAEADAS